MADLEAAYSIGSVAEAQRVYASWASTYDVTFAEKMGYAAPQRIAELFLAEGGQTAQPVLDIGAGTGLVAEALPGLEIDGIDISPEMLARLWGCMSMIGARPSMPNILATTQLRTRRPSIARVQT